MSKKPVKFENQTMTLQVNYGDVSIGEKTARVSVKVDRDALGIAQADKAICDKRLTGKIERRPPGEVDGQGRLPGMEGIGVEALSGVFDVKGFSVTKKHISFGLTFALASIDIGKLASFAKRSGSLVVESSEAIPEDNGEMEVEEP